MYPIVIGLLACSTVGADQLDIIAASKHGVLVDLDATYDFNESNIGLGYIADNGVTVGAYNNSYRHTSVYVGYTVETHAKYLNVGVVSGLVTGYTGLVSPMVMPYVLIGPSDVRLKVGYIPGAFTFMLNVEL